MPDRLVKILYFAWLREKIGLAEETVELPTGVTTAAALISWLKTRSGGYAAAFADENIVRCAIDQEFADAAATLDGASEIAFFPPMTGG